MKKIWINNKILIIAFAAILVFVGILISIFITKKTNKTNNKDIILDNRKVLSVNNFNIDGRTVFKLGNNIYIGNNLKELENGFYDIRLQNIDSGICVYLNKLWYENYGKDYIQDDYLARICRELCSKLNVQNNTEEFEYMLYKYVKDNYTKVRNNEEVEKVITEDISMEFELEDNIVKLIIRGR